MPSLQAPSTYAFQKATVGTTSVGLTDIGFSAQDVESADFCIIGVESQPVRARTDGGAATGTDGLLLKDGDILTVAGNTDIVRLRLRRASTASSDSTLQIFLQRYS